MRLLVIAAVVACKDPSPPSNDGSALGPPTTPGTPGTPGTPSSTGTTDPAGVPDGGGDARTDDGSVNPGLPPALGELYHLRVSGLSYEQIAGVVDVPVGTVKSRMHQMVHALREELKPWIAPE